MERRPTTADPPQEDCASSTVPPERVAWHGIVGHIDPEISASDYREIDELIVSEDSPVGIDAKKTHVIIIHKLLQIEQRLERLERLAAGEGT